MSASATPAIFSTAALTLAARDLTEYGTATTATTSFYIHHLRRISNAIVIADARAIAVGIAVIEANAAAGRWDPSGLRPTHKKTRAPKGAARDRAPPQ